MEAYVYNKPSDAALLFEDAIRQGNADSLAYLYLALSYEQLGLYDQASTVLKDALIRAPQYRAQIYFNLGNVLAKQGKNSEAMEAYENALAAQRSLVDAYLNRANLQMRQQNYDSALADYRSFVQLAPNHAQAPAVNQMIQLLEKDRVAREEEQAARLEAERRAQLEAQAESERQMREAEQLAREEEARRRALLDSVFSSLGSASSAPSALGTGADSVIHVEEDLSIDF